MPLLRRAKTFDPVDRVRLSAHPSPNGWHGIEAGGNPPTAFTISSRFRARASLIDRPLTSSVKADPHAIDATQPRARKWISSIRPSGAFTMSCRTSPHAGFSNFGSRHVRRVERSRVPRMLKMIEKFRRIHRRNPGRAAQPHFVLL